MNGVHGDKPWFPEPGDMKAEQNFLDELAEKPALLEEAWSYVEQHPELESTHAELLGAMRERFTIGSPDIERLDLGLSIVVEKPVLNFREALRARTGDEEAVYALLERYGPDWDVLDNNGQAFIHALVECEPAIAGAVLRVYNPNVRDQYGRPPLFQILWQLKKAAVEEDDEGVAVQLVLLDALLENKECDLTVTPNGASAIHMLCALRDHQCICRISASKLEALTSTLLSRVLESEGAEVCTRWLNSVDEASGMTMLEAAARFGFLDLVRLLSADDRVEVRNPIALLIESPTYFPKISDRQMHNTLVDVVGILGARDSRRNQASEAGLAPAEERYSPRFMGWINEPGPGNHTPVMLASELGMPETVSYLLKQGARLTAVNQQGRNALHLAAIGGDLRCVSLLLKAGLAPDKQDKHDLSPMDYLLLGGDTDFIVGASNDERVVSSLAHSVRLSGLQSSEQSQMLGQLQKLTKKRSSGVSRMLSSFGIDPVDWDKLFDAPALQERLSRGRNEQLDQPISEDVQAAAHSLWNWCRSRVVDFRADLSPLEQSRVAGSSSIRSEPRKLKAWQQADAMVRGWASEGKPLSAEGLCKLNSLLYPKGGKLRQCPVRAGMNSRFMYSFDGFVEKEVAETISWINTQIRACQEAEANPLLVAAKAYQRMVSTHPFGDANGRTCRLVMDYICLSCGLPPPCVGLNVNTAVFALSPRKSCSTSHCVLKVLRAVASSYRLMGKPLPSRMQKNLYEM